MISALWGSVKSSWQRIVKMSCSSIYSLRSVPRSDDWSPITLFTSAGRSSDHHGGSDGVAVPAGPCRLSSDNSRSSVTTPRFDADCNYITFVHLCFVFNRQQSPIFVQFNSMWVLTPSSGQVSTEWLPAGVLNGETTCRGIELWRKLQFLVSVAWSVNMES